MNYNTFDFPGIYRAVNIINGKSYIGKSRNIAERIEYHKNNYLRSKYDNKLFYIAIRKYGIENFIFYVLDRFNSQDEYDSISNDKERYWIRFYNTYTKSRNSYGYNLTIGGDGGMSSKEVRQRWGRLTEDEVYYLRERYLECKYPGSVIYEKEFKDKISYWGFLAVYLGKNSKDIHYDVYTQESKEKHDKLEHLYVTCMKRRKRISFEQNKRIRDRRERGQSWRQIFKEEHLNKVYSSPDSVNHLYRTLALDERIDIYGELEPLYSS